MKVAIIGAGNIALAHGPAIKAIEGSQVVGVCDTNILRAESTAKKLEAKNYYADAGTMIAESRPDVVHVLTPPATHFELAMLAMKHGCNVLIEKPMAVSVKEAEDMMAEAEKRQVKICTGHNMVFDAHTRKAMRIIADGKIGKVVSVESCFRFDPNRYPAVRASGAQFAHWIYQLHGGPLQDLIPHPASLIFEFLDGFDEAKTVTKEGSILPSGWPEEVRVVLRSRDTLAYLSVSLREKPEKLTLTVHGDSGSIHVDYFSGTITVQRTSVLPRAVTRLLLGFRTAFQLFAASTANIFRVAFGKYDTSVGTNLLIKRFYESINNEQAPDPMSHKQMVDTIRLIDAIWPEPSPGLLQAQDEVRKYRRKKAVKNPKALVTGASGFIGSHMLKRLADEGIPARALVRPNSINAGRLIGSSADVFCADLADSESIAKACEGIEVVFHAGASTSGDWESNEQATINGTRNILEAARNQGVKKIVHLSTLAVYELLDKAKNQIVTEDSGYQLNPRKMGPYAYCKIEAEKLLKEAIDSNEIGITILRPGMVIGEGCYPFFPHFGFNLGGKLFLTIGKGDVPLPFTYVGTVVDAMYRASTNDAAAGGIYNIVDDAKVTARQYLDKYIEVTNADARIISLPYAVPYLAFGGYEVASAIGILPKGITSRAQLKWKQARVFYDTSRAKKELEWQPLVDMETAMVRTFQAFAEKYL